MTGTTKENNKTGTFTADTAIKCAKLLGEEYEGKSPSDVLWNLAYKLVEAETGWKFLNSAELTREEKLALLRGDFITDTLNFHVAGQLAENDTRSAVYILKNFPELNNEIPDMQFAVLAGIARTLGGLVTSADVLSDSGANTNIPLETLQELTSHVASTAEIISKLRKDTEAN